MMNAEEWRKGLSPWESIKKQSEIDNELAELVISAIEKKIKELEEKENGE